jgi:hypothetical protein
MTLPISSVGGISFLFLSLFHECGAVILGWDAIHTLIKFFFNLHLYSFCFGTHASNVKRTPRKFKFSNLRISTK